MRHGGIGGGSVHKSNERFPIVQNTSQTTTTVVVPASNLLLSYDQSGWLEDVLFPSDKHKH